MKSKMICNLENCLASAFFLAMTFAFTNSQNRKCTLTAAPHPEGICGTELTIAHANLCFLLRRAYPQIFSAAKRSSSQSSYNLASSSSSSSSSSSPSSQHGRHSRLRRRRRDMNGLQKIYSIPVAVLASLRLTDENWRSFVYKRDLNTREITGEINYTSRDLEQLPALKRNPARLLIRMLSKRSNPTIHKRSSGLACDCCINACDTRHLATYC